MAVGLALPTLCAGQTRQWNNPASGWWNAATNWTPADVPDTTAEAALVPAELGPTTVELNISPNINWLDLQTGTLWLHGLGITTSAGLTNQSLIRLDSGHSTINGGLEHFQLISVA